jgi:hypothetical protein
VAYQQASRAGKLAVNLSNKTRSTADTQSRILDDLRSVDVAKELPRWRLAERIYTERSLPWSRLTAELERSLVREVRLKSVQRNRSTDMKVQLKIKGEARSRDGEAAFVESLQKNPFFEQVILEREGERQGGGVDFDYTLAVGSTPPPYQPLPKYAPQPKTKVAAAPAKAPAPLPRPSGVAVPPPGIAVPPPSLPPAAAPAAPAPAQMPEGVLRPPNPMQNRRTPRIRRPNPSSEGDQ